MNTYMEKSFSNVCKDDVDLSTEEEKETLKEENLTAKRPGTGISPMRWNEVIGTKAVRDFEEDEQIEL